MNFKNFSFIEKQAVAKVLNDIAIADYELHEKELDVMAYLMQLFDISLHDLQQSDDMSVIRCINILKEMSSTKKIVFLKMMTDVVKADGVITKEETSLVATIAVAAGIPLN